MRRWVLSHCRFDVLCVGYIDSVKKSNGLTQHQTGVQWNVSGSRKKWLCWQWDVHWSSQNFGRDGTVVPGHQVHLGSMCCSLRHTLSKYVTCSFRLYSYQ
jgi:hypothetical protein